MSDRLTCFRMQSELWTVKENCLWSDWLSWHWILHLASLVGQYQSTSRREGQRSHDASLQWPMITNPFKLIDAFSESQILSRGFYGNSERSTLRWWLKDFNALSDDELNRAMRNFLLEHRLIAVARWAACSFSIKLTFEIEIDLFMQHEKYCFRSHHNRLFNHLFTSFLAVYTQSFTVSS